MLTAGDLQQMPLAIQPTQIVPGVKGSMVTLYNQDVNNVVNVSYRTNGQPSVPIQPLTSGVFDSSRSLYASAKAGTLPLAVLPGMGSNLSPSPAQIAAQIASTGVFIDPVDTLVSGQSAQSLPPGNTTIYSGPIVGTSYGFWIDALCVAAPVAPFYTVAFLWKDANGNTVGDQKWCFLATQIAPAKDNALAGGNGPTDASSVTIIVHNFDTSNMTFDWNLYSSSRSFLEHDLKNVSNNIIGGFTYMGITFETPISNEPMNILGAAQSLSVPSGLTGTTRILGVYAGRVQLFFQGITVTSGQIALAFVDPDLTGNEIQNFYNPVIPASGTLGPIDFNFPRCPVLFGIINNGASTGSIQYSIIRQSSS